MKINRDLKDIASLTTGVIVAFVNSHIVDKFLKKKDTSLVPRVYMGATSSIGLMLMTTMGMKGALDSLFADKPLPKTEEEKEEEILPQTNWRETMKAQKAITPTNELS